MESNNRARLSSFLNNRRALIIISVLLAVITWLAISINESPEVERTVKGVRVQVDESLPSQLGYQAFGADNLTVDVTVRGKRYEVGDNVLSANDIRVVAVTSYVDAPGQYTLQLRATAKDPNANYTIISKSRDFAEVYFDTPKVKDIALEPVVNRSSRLLESNEYMTADPVLSRKKLTLYGPTTEIDKIEHAYAVVSTDGHLRKPETQQASIRFADKGGNTVRRYIQNRTGPVTLTIPVYRKTRMPVSVDFSNVPSAYTDELPGFKISPASIDVGVDPTKLRDMDSISLGTIDFSRLTTGTNTFTFSSSDITDGIPLKKEQTYTVTVNVEDMTTREVTLDLSRTRFQNVPAGYQVSRPNTSITLTLVGPAEDLQKVKASDLSAVADLKNVNLTEGENDIPLRILVNSDTCWSYGTHTAAVTAKKSVN
ncbi:MAG: hypothetical protein PUC71_04525 [Oscillospiraceae bacterium]|nr:hypothetical protein [Oscillospiraceae bacterium]